MAVYIDKLFNHGWNLGSSCHMIADSIEELKTFAVSIGLKVEWFQPCPPSSIPHFDLTAGRRAAAVKKGAVEMNDFRDFVKKVRELRESGNWTGIPQDVVNASLLKFGAENGAF